MAKVNSGSHIGILLLPLDGNPFRACTALAHPTGVGCTACGVDGHIVSSSVGRCPEVLVWRVNVGEAEGQARERGGLGLKPFLHHLQFDVLRELKEFYYHLVIKSNGEARGHKLPVSKVGNLMRALGHYPSEREILEVEDMLKHNGYESGVDMDTFIQVFFNHRPVSGIRYEDVEASFQILGDERGEIDRDRFKLELGGRGENMGREEMERCVKILLDDKEITTLPSKISAATFCKYLLGLSVDTPLTESYLDMEREELEERIKRDKQLYQYLDKK